MLKYTGRADVLTVDGKDYKPGDNVPISEELAAVLIKHSRLHSFETPKGQDLLDKLTGGTPEDSALASAMAPALPSAPAPAAPATRK